MQIHQESRIIPIIEFLIIGKVTTKLMYSTMVSEEVAPHFTHAAVIGQRFTAIAIAPICNFMIDIIPPITGGGLLVMTRVGKFVKYGFINTPPIGICVIGVLPPQPPPIRIFQIRNPMDCPAERISSQ